MPIAEVQGTLALDLQPRQAPPSGLPRTTWMTYGAGDPADGSRNTAGMSPRATQNGGDDEADVVPIDRAERHERHELDGWVSRFAQAAVEIVGGDRPVTQLLRWTSAGVYAELERRALLVARAGHHQPGQGRVQPVRPKVVSARSSFITPGVVEASIHIRYGARSRALAARFEARHTRWVCTALEWA
ncbi:Rv3235 family protein [Nocardioides sp. Iso805N]|uniref:Rv3235 family protein n=1 Tax=Nocardioides sp. Iso805N TaxID=1283287 RepID=UPI0003A74B66|nr:Rv3235 family protein [Nocardioides sp. Iso805N]